MNKRDNQDQKKPEVSKATNGQQKSLFDQTLSMVAEVSRKQKPGPLSKKQKTQKSDNSPATTPTGSRATSTEPEGNKVNKNVSKEVVKIAIASEASKVTNSPKPDQKKPNVIQEVNLESNKDINRTKADPEIKQQEKSSSTSSSKTPSQPDTKTNEKDGTQMDTSTPKTVLKKKLNGNYILLLIHSASPQSWPVVITIFTHVRTSSLSNIVQYKTK